MDQEWHPEPANTQKRLQAAWLNQLAWFILSSTPLLMRKFANIYCENSFLNVIWTYSGTHLQVMPEAQWVDQLLTGLERTQMNF